VTRSIAQVIGQRLDVLWDLGSGSKKHKVRWGAIVASGFEGSSASACRGAKIRYDTIHGHESTESTVRFFSSSILEEIQGGGNYVRHQWRWEGNAPPEQGSDAACLPVLAPPPGDVMQGLLVTNVWRHSRESWLMRYRVGVITFVISGVGRGLLRPNNAMMPLSFQC
jgi:hypothetical protein